MGWEEHAIWLKKPDAAQDDDFSVTRELKRSIGQTPALIGSAIEGVGAAIPGEFIDPVTEGISRGLTEYSTYLTEGIAPNPVPSFQEIIPEGKTFIEAPIESISRGLTYVGGATGQGIGSLAAQGAGMAAGALIGGVGGLAVGGPAGAVAGAGGGAIAGRGASSFGQNYGEIFQALKEEAPLYNAEHPDAPISAEELGQAALIPGLGAAAIDYVSFGRLMPVLEDAGKFVGLSPKQAAKEIMKSYAKGFATEAPAEGAQEAIKVATSTGTFDREATPEEKASIIDASIMGGLGGGVVGSAGQAIPIVSGMARKGPTRDDLAAAISGDAPLVSEPLDSIPDAAPTIEPIPQEQFDPVTGEVVLNRDDLATAMESGVVIPNVDEGKKSTLDELENQLSVIQSQAKATGWNNMLLTKRAEVEGQISDMKKQEVDLAAYQATPEPTEAQKDAGNYQKGHTNISGLDISIENAKGSIRSGVDGDGEAWETTMPAHYGYIKRTEGADGDHVDTYIGDNPDAKDVFVVDQVDLSTGKFDEHKVMIGFNNLDRAMGTYNAGFSDGLGHKRIGGITTFTIDEFKDWLKNGDTKKPIAFQQAKGFTPENENPVTLPTLTEQTPAQPEIKRGTVGMRLGGGESVTTNTGRTTSPFPTIALGSPRRVNLTVENVKKWLMQNALDEALARGDEFNARQFEANLKRASQADLDSAESYLFDPAFVFDNPPSILKPLSTPETEQKTEYVAPQKPENATEPAENIDMKPNTVSEEANSSKDSPAPEVQKEIGSEPEITTETPVGAENAQTEIDTSNWIVERLPQGEGQKRKGIIKAKVIKKMRIGGDLIIRRTREYPENTTDFEIIKIVAMLEKRDEEERQKRIEATKNEPPANDYGGLTVGEYIQEHPDAVSSLSKEEMEYLKDAIENEADDASIEEIINLTKAYHESAVKEQEEKDEDDRKLAQYEADGEVLEEISNKISSFLDGKKDVISYEEHGSSLSRSGYFDIYLYPVFEEDNEKAVDAKQKIKVRVSDHILPPTYGRDNGWADFEFGIRNTTDPEFHGSDPQQLFDYIEKKLEKFKLETAENKPSEPETQVQGRQLILTRDNVQKVVDAVTSNWKFSNAADGHIQITPKNNIDAWSSGERAAIVSAIEGAGMSIAQNALKSSGKYIDENKNAKNIIRVIGGQEQFSPAGFIDKYVSGISKYQEKSDVENMSDNVDEQDQATKKQDRGRKMQDVGEKLEGKRALQEKLGKASYPEKAKEIIDATKPKNAFKFQQRDGQTSGVARFAQKLQENLYDYSEYLKSRGTISRSRSRYSKMYGWEQQLANIFADGADLNGADIGPRNSISEGIVVEYRQKIIESAEEYVELAARLNDMFENADNIEQFKAELSNAFEDGDFKALFDKYAKTYGLKRDIFSDSYYSPFAKITDESEVQKPNRVEKTLTRPKLEKIERIGLKDRRNGRDVSEQEFMDTFGFRGVEFGEWVSSKEGQSHVNLAFDALYDLADRIGINPKHISLGGKLGFAFGSRGKGEHSAHFEPMNNVINLTKTRGDGAVAHEWLHALDHNLTQSGKEGAAFINMAYKAMNKKPIEDAQAKVENRLKDFLKGTAFWQRGSRKMKMGVVGEAKYTIEQYVNRPFQFMFSDTEYSIEGNKLGSYWGSDKELLARAWEGYIYDTLGGTNPYLVNDWVADGAVSKENGYRGTIYPTGEERQRFAKIFDKLIDGIEFSDSGVKIKEGANLPIADEAATMIDMVKSFEPKLNDMLKEIENGSLQQTQVQTGVSDGDGGASTGDVSGAATDEDIEHLFGRDRTRGPSDVQENGGTLDEGKGDGAGRGGNDRGGDRIQRDDTVPEQPREQPPEFSAQGVNHKIPVGALDEKRGHKQKAKDNLEIIRTVKLIESENRAATPEEQTLLAKFTGWGSLKNAFPKGDGKTIEKGWEDINSSLKSLLTENEYKEARKSIQFAHYTSEVVVRSMWTALQKFGLKHGNVFEPGMGIGNFTGMIPDGMSVEYAGLELDPMTHRIARILYPQASIRNADFISARYGDNTFDAAIGNPPFADTKITADPKYRSKALSLHNYFFAKTIDMLAHGGVMAFVTSRYSMDAMDSSARKFFAEKVDLVGAIRLPNTAFKTNANTEVVTDIIFLRKRLKGEESNGTKWLETRDMPIESESGEIVNIPVNEYFHDHPEMILGNVSLTGTMHSKNEFTVEPAESSDLQVQLAEAISRLPENIITDIQKSETQGIDFTPIETKEGAYYLKDGTLMQVSDGVGAPVSIRGKGTGGMASADVEKIKMLVPVKLSLRKAMDAMIRREDAEMRSAQKDLSKQYEAFVKKYGPITKSESETRAATVGDVEEARNDVRQDYLEAGEEFNEGDIDLSHLIGKVNPDTGKKYTNSQIGAMRKKMREEMEAKGQTVDEGDFNPADVPPSVIIRYPNLDLFMDDPEAYDLMILENYNEETGLASRTDVFSKNIVADVKKPELKTSVDSLNYSLMKLNRVDIDFMSSELGKNKDEIIAELEDLDLIYRIPNAETGEDVFVYSEEYLSGFVKDKLAYAKKLAEFDPIYKRNVLALEAVQPKDIPASDINTQLGSPYFDEAVIRDFMRDALNISAKVTRVQSVNSWDVSSQDRYSPENTTQWGTEKRNATDLVESMLMRRNIQVTYKNEDGSQVVNIAETQAAQDKAKLIQEKFSDWIWKSSHSERIFRKYNDEFNNVVPRKYNGEHITTAISPSIKKLFAHQKNVIWRILQSGNTHMAHGVGAGKTLAMASAAMEMRRLGNWRKPMIVVPNHMLAQFAGEFKLAYPQARILIADKKKTDKDHRQKFVALAAKGDYDAIVIPFSAFSKISVSKGFDAKMMDAQVAKYRMALEETNRVSGKRSGTASQLEKQIQKMEQRIAKLKNAEVDEAFYFEQLGVDALIVDEAHYFRKLSFPTNQGNVKGVSPVGSKAAWDLYAKTRYLDTIHPGRNLVMASGTPLTNTLAEVFTLQRFMDERSLVQRGLDSFDSWSATFAASVSAPERQPSGSYKTVTRLSEFRNLGTLSPMVRRFMDVVTSEELASLVDRPTLKSGAMIIKTTKPSTAYLAFQKYLEHRTQAIAGKRSNEKGADNILNIIGEGRQAAIDMRMIDPTLPEEPSKLTDMVDNVLRIWKETSSDTFKNKYSGDDKISQNKGGAQLIFSDLGVNGKTKNGVSFSAYSYIRRTLVNKGVPAKQIAFISDYETEDDKRRLQNMVKNGEIRILIGSTSKMGTGLNVQNRLKAVHNLDAPWLPADLEQRSGRVLRQGNQYKEVEIYGYGTEGSYDSTMWGMLETKAKAIISFLKGDSDVSSMRDIEETDMFRIAKAMTSGDPRVLKQAELQSEVERLGRQSRNFTNEQVKIKSDLAKKKSGIERAKQQISHIEEANKKAIKPEEGKFLMTVSGKPYTERAEAAGALDAAIASVMSQNVNTASDGVKIGSLYGFDVNFFMSVANLATKYEIFLDHPAFSEQSQTWTTLDNETFSPSGAITRLINSINRLDKAKENEQRIIEMNAREIGVLESQQTGDFPKQKEYESKKAELAQIDKDLQENAPVEVTYDQYPVEYWEENKSAISRPSFSIVGDDEFRIDRSSVRMGKRAKIMRALERAAKKMNIPLDSIELFSDVKDVLNIPNVDNAIEDGRVEGFYYKNLIYIAMTADDPVSTLTHEVVHKLKAAKAFTDSEWKYLTSHAAEWRTKYQIEKHYAKLKGMTEEKMDEEAIAHAVQDYANKGFLERVRNRLKMWFNMIRSVLTGDEFKFSSPEEVFEAILEGQISDRKFSTDTSAMTMFQSISETVAELEDRLVKRYGIRLSLTGKSPVTISMIKVEESQRRNGVAKAVIQEITDWADKTGTVLSLTPTDEYGIRKSVLERFYERNGFVSNSGKNKDFSISESMIRLPIKSTPDVKNDAAMFSFFGNVVGKKLTKKDQLNAAIDALGLENTDKKLRPALSLISSYILHPRQIAALYDKFAPVFMEVTKMMQRRDKIVHELTVLMNPYNHLTLEHKNRVNAVLELGRLKKENFAVKDGRVTAHNVGLSDAVFSKPGEDITLDEMETKAYLGARKAMDKALDIYEQTILEEYGYLSAGIDSVEKLEYLIEDTPDDTVRGHMEEALELLYQIEDAKRTGYIPLKRWGEIGITVRSKTEMVEDENGEEKPKLLHFERVELPKFRKNKILENADVLEAIKKLRDKYGDSVDIDYFEVKDFATLRTKLNLAELDVLAASSDMSREEYDALREALGDAMKRKGFKAHFFTAEDVPGYSDDFERALNDYIVSISGHLSRKMHETPIADKMKEIADSGQERLFEYARKYVTYVTDPVEEFRAMRQINFMWYLAGNIASGVTNASQPFMVTAPWFKAMFSHGDIFKQMTRAYKETASMLSIKAGLDVFDFDKAPADVREILKLADEDGMFIPLQTHDAMAIAYSSSTNMRGIGRTMRTAQDALALTFTIPERTNRVVTYISAYRFAIDPKNKDGIMRFVGTDALARAELAGKTGRKFAMAFAEYAVYSTQLQMGRPNRPTLSRGIGTLPFQFMSFSMQIMELMYRLTKIHGGKSGTTLAIMLLAVVAMSGIKGFPFEDDVQAMIEAAYKRLTLVDLDIDTEMKGILTDTVGEKMAHAIMYGVPSALLNVDMSARLGYGNLVPDDQGDMLGIWWDMLYTRPTNAMTSLSRGDALQAFADISPAILKNPLQAFIWSQDGVKSASTGDMVITPDDLTDADIGLKALGFTSGSISKERQRIFAQRRANMAVNDLRSVYYDKLARAYAGMILASREGDLDKKYLYQLEIQAIYEEKEAYNKDAPIYKKIIIHQPSLKKRVAEELLGAKANKPRKQARAQAQKIDEIYGK